MLETFQANQGCQAHDSLLGLSWPCSQTPTSRHCFTRKARGHLSTIGKPYEDVISGQNSCMQSTTRLGHADWRLVLPQGPHGGRKNCGCYKAVAEGSWSREKMITAGRQLPALARDRTLDSPLPSSVRSSPAEPCFCRVPVSLHLLPTSDFPALLFSRSLFPRARHPRAGLTSSLSAPPFPSFFCVSSWVPTLAV